MLIKSSVILLFVFISTISMAQNYFMEKLKDNYLRFYYDENYILVDKDCEFKAIQRVAQCDTLNKRFEGEFKDFDNSGYPILHGFYKEGKRNGKFTAYHPNGNIRWESTFIDNLETGEWKYYYPDGKPLLTLFFTDTSFNIVSFWDKYGNQKIVDGNGDYEMTFPIKGFTDHGYTSYLRSGKVVNGKLEGKWSTYFVSDTKNNTHKLAFQEEFVQGEKTKVNRNKDFIEYFINYDDFTYVPSDYFPRAELFNAHGCTFDEFSGFKNFLIRKITDALSYSLFKITDIRLKYSTVYEVNKKGVPYFVKASSSIEDIPIGMRSKIQSYFNSIYYVIPSVKDGKTINDNVTFTIDLSIIDGKGILNSLKIQREKGE